MNTDEELVEEIQRLQALVITNKKSEWERRRTLVMAIVQSSIMAGAFAWSIHWAGALPAAVVLGGWTTFITMLIIFICRRDLVL